MTKPKIKIMQVIDGHGCHGDDGAPAAYWCFAEEGEKFDKVIRRDGKAATLEDLVGLCDRDAENVNAHDFVGSHRLLGGLLFRDLGRKLATKIMLRIAERRGQHGMGGLCGLPDSYAELGVGEDGKDWEGEYK